jgi:hypothetical protein
VSGAQAANPAPRFLLPVDPFSQQAELTALDGAVNDRFGASVAISGDTIAVGAPGRNDGGGSEEGAVYVFTQSASGGWQPVAVLTPSDTGNDVLGQSVAIDGDTIVAGAPGAGALYVFTEPTSGGWQNATQTAVLTQSDGSINDSFGQTVAISGDTIIAGAAGHNVGGNPNQGAVYVFTRPGSGGWANATQSAELTASDGAAQDELGSSVAISGNIIVSGAPGRDTSAGAVYTFTEPSIGGWTQASQAELTNPNRTSLGREVAVSGGTVAASAGDAIDVYAMPPTGWAGTDTPTAELTASDGGPFGPTFGGGQALWISGTTIAASQWQKTVGANSNQGGLYLFTEPASGWQSETEAQQLTASDGAAGDELGSWLAFSGQTIVAGAPGRDNSTGAAYAFAPPAPAPTSTLVTSSQNPSVFGQPVTFTATVSGASTPTGSVQFVVDGGDFGSPVALVAGPAGSATASSAPDASLAVAGSPHSVSADYIPSGNFIASSGALPAGQTVAPAPTSISLTSSQNASLAGQPVTFRVTVSPVAPGAGRPTGTVTFYDGNTSLGTQTLSADTAAFASRSLAPGSHTITAGYSGDSNFGASTGSLVQTVLAGPLTGTLDFGDVPAGRFSAPHRLFVRNVSARRVTVGPITLSGSPQPAGLQYRVKPVLGGNHCAGMALAPGARCTIDLEINAGDALGPQGVLAAYGGPFTAQISLGSSPITLTGIEVPGVLGGSLDFGDVPAGQFSAPRPLVVRNLSSGTVTVGSVVVGGRLSAPQPAGLKYQVRVPQHGNPCSGIRLAAGGRCTIDLEIDAGKATGPQGGLVAYAGPFIVQAGVGSSPVALTGIEVPGVLGGSLDFGDVPARIYSAPHRLFVRNLSARSVTPGPVALGGPGLMPTPGGLDYQMKAVHNGNQCTGVPVPGGGRCVLDLEIRAGQAPGPTGALQPYTGPFSVQIAFGPSALTLTGNEVPGVLGGSLDFGSVPAGRFSAARTLVVHNLSAQPVIVGSIVFGGPGLTAPQPAGLVWRVRAAPHGNHCTGASLPGGGRCTIDLEIDVAQAQGTSGALQPYSGPFVVQMGLGRSPITLTGNEM